MNKPPSLAELGEFGLIARLARRFAAPPAAGLAPGLKVGIGDDAAVWAPTPGSWLVVTVDALIEDVHFRLRTTDWYDLGWKSLAVNLSDVAAMGARPRYAVISMGLPGALAVGAVEEFCRGLADLAGRFDTAIVGGDTVASPSVAISVTLFGETVVAAAGQEPPLLRRTAGRAGDAVAVTGALGASAGGLRLLETGVPRADAAAAALRQAHRRPTPRVAEARVLLEHGVRCAMDLSDGLLGDAQRLATASEVGVVLEAARLPVAPALAALWPQEALDLALEGGEDYELLCTAPPETLAAAGHALAALGVPLTVVGRLTEPPADGPGVHVVDPDGKPRPRRGGYAHFQT